MSSEFHRACLRHDIINDCMSLFSMLYFSTQPEIIRQAEIFWNFPITGNLTSLMENFRKHNYTRRYPFHENIDYCLRNAAEHKHTDIVYIMLERGATDYNNAMINASRAGDLIIVKLMIDRGAKCFNWAMNSAAVEGHLEIIQLMLECGADDYANPLSNAAYKGHIEIVKLLMEREAKFKNLALYEAAGGGHLEIVKMLISKYGADDYNSSIIYALHEEHLEVAKFLLESGANNFEKIIRIAVKRGYDEIIKSCSTFYPVSLIEFQSVETDVPELKWET